MGKNVHNNYLMGLIFWKCWSVALKKFRIFMGIWIFFKTFQKYRFHVVVWSQNLRFSFFSYGLIFKRISSQKKASLACTVPKPSMR